MKEVPVKLSKAEINHLLVHLKANGQNTGTDYDWYYANPVQFKKRHERLKQKLENAISTSQKQIETNVIRSYFKFWFS